MHSLHTFSLASCIFHLGLFALHRWDNYSWNAGATEPGTCAWNAEIWNEIDAYGMVVFESVAKTSWVYPTSRLFVCLLVFSLLFDFVHILTGGHILAPSAWNNAQSHASQTSTAGATGGVLLYSFELLNIHIISHLSACQPNILTYCFFHHRSWCLQSVHSQKQCHSRLGSLHCWRIMQGAVCMLIGRESSDAL